MRKVSRGSSTGRRSGTARTDRSTKPGFRPKGNNAGSPKPSRSRDDDGGESRGSYGRNQGEKRPRVSSDRDRSSGTRSRFSGSDRSERPSSRSRGAREYGEDRPYRAAGARSSFNKSAGSGEAPARRSYSRDSSSEERPTRRSYSDTTGREERPARRTSFTRDSNSEERPTRRSYSGDTGREERPARRTSFSRDSNSEERPMRRSYSGDTGREERPARRASYSRDSSSEERPTRRSYSGDTGREERPARRTSYSKDSNSEERPTRRSYSGDAARDERPVRRTSYSRESSPDERPSRRPSREGNNDERPSRRSYSNDAGSNDRPYRSRDENEGGRKSFGDTKRGTGGRFAGSRDKRPQTFRAKKSTLADDGQTRLNKYISNCGICSRREADDLIKAGVISVNGNIITEMGFKVNPGDEVRYNNEILRGEKPVYLLLNKPKDYITTVDDPGQRHTVMELVEGACNERIYPVGRLDRNTTGVLLFTNDGDLARKLMHPSFNVQKVYHVTLSKAMKPEEMEKILNGIHLEDGPIKADDIAYAGDGTDRKEVGIELHSGRNRIVRRIFESFGHEVVKLDRTVFAGLTKKDLTRGRYRFLTAMEVANLKMMVGEKRYREAMLNEQ